MRVIEVFADVRCPFTHVGLRRFVEARSAAGCTEVGLRVRAWPLELVNGAPLDPDLIAEEVGELQAQVAPELFTGFDPARFPTSSLPALDLAAAADGQEAGEQVSLALRDALFEAGQDITSPAVLREVADEAGIELPRETARAEVHADWHEGEKRGVIGSPHFFVDGTGFFCPSLDIGRTDEGLRITYDDSALNAFFALCFGA